MHLVIVSERMGDVGPVALRRTCLGYERRVEPDDPGVEFRRNSDLPAELTLKLADPEAGLRRRLTDVRRALLEQKPVGDLRDRIGSLNFAQTLREKVAGDANAFVEAARVGQLLLELREPGTDDATGS